MAVCMSSDETIVDAPGGAEPPAEPATPPSAPAKPARSITHGRLILVDALVVIAAVLSFVGLFAVWANRQLFNPNNWSKTSTQLLQNADIRSTAANFIVDQIYANVDVAQLLRSNLPTALQGLAAPVSGALHSAAVQGTELALSRPELQNAWARANKAADQAFVQIVKGGNKHVSVNNGEVTLNLDTIINDVAASLGLPSDLGNKLPPSAAKLVILKSNQLKAVQDIGNAVQGLALWLDILVPLLWILVLYLARGHRRRTMMTIGFSIVIVGILTLLLRRILETQVTSSLVQDASQRPAVSAAVLIGTGMLAEIAEAFVFVGVVVVLAAWFAGPSRFAFAGRRVLAPALRHYPAACFGVVALIMILIFIWQPIPATGTPAGMIVFFVLAMVGTELLRRQTDAEFPRALADPAGSPPAVASG